LLPAQMLSWVPLVRKSLHLWHAPPLLDDEDVPELDADDALVELLVVPLDVAAPLELELVDPAAAAPVPAAAWAPPVPAVAPPVPLDVPPDPQARTSEPSANDDPASARETEIIARWYHVVRGRSAGGRAATWRS
jgi:hypothetical protein